MKPETNPILRFERRTTHLNAIKAMCWKLYFADRRVRFLDRRGEEQWRNISAKELKVHMDGYGYPSVNIGEKTFRVHRLVAEAAIGGPLPKGAEIHHVDGDKTNNSPGNLVICQNRAYHCLLHVRQEALEATGDPNARKCFRCGEYGNPEQMRSYKGKVSPRYSHYVSAGHCVVRPYQPKQKARSPQSEEQAA